MHRNLLVVGATGKQGSALIREILKPSAADNDDKYRIYAVTRKASSPAAQSLRNLGGEDVVRILEGDLDVPATISKIFDDAKADGGFWGVFVALAFPGLGVEAHGEEKQAKLLADLSLQFGVKVFVYSSAMRCGPKYDPDMVWSSKAKVNNEIYCKSLGEKGLPWIIIQPGFFMENFDDFIGSIGVAILKQGLKPDTTVALIASEDIGNVAAGVIRNHEKYMNKTVAPVSEFVTISQIEASYKRATGKPIPAVPSAFAWVLIKINKASQNLVKNMELNHKARSEGDYPTYEGDVELAKSAYPMKTFYEWILQGKSKKQEAANWNQVSVGKLVTGRS